MIAYHILTVPFDTDPLVYVNTKALKNKISVNITLSFKNYYLLITSQII